ncbi:MAG: DUF4143 domain-containing protein [Eubacteriales bacterium]|nr:DUF4143 domain-containing protein [Eubacteriales bacterium]
MNYIHRNLEDIIEDAATKQPVIMLYGQRMSGKSTLLKNTGSVSRYNYVSLREISDRAEAAQDAAAFLLSKRAPLIIDDIQYVPTLISELAKLISSDKLRGPYILVSSMTPAFYYAKGYADTDTSVKQAYFTFTENTEDNNFKVGKTALQGEDSDSVKQTGNTESLAIPCICMNTLTQCEISGGRLTTFSLDESKLRRRAASRKSFDARGITKRMYRGSMPVLVCGDSNDRAAVYNELLTRITEQDLRLISEAIEPLSFYSFIKSAAKQCGMMLNISKTAEETGLNQKQTKDLYAVLEYLGIAFMLYPYSDGKLTRLVKTPKLYFYDTGLAAFLLGIKDANAIAPYSEQLFNNYTVSELAKSFLAGGVEPRLYYYRNKDAKEINVIIEEADRLIPININDTEIPAAGLCENFSLIDKARLPHDAGALICMCSNIDVDSNGIYKLPLWII